MQNSWYGVKTVRQQKYVKNWDAFFKLVSELESKKIELSEQCTREHVDEVINDARNWVSIATQAGSEAEANLKSRLENAVLKQIKGEQAVQEHDDEMLENLINLHEENPDAYMIYQCVKCKKVFISGNFHWAREATGRLDAIRHCDETASYLAKADAENIRKYAKELKESGEY